MLGNQFGSQSQLLGFEDLGILRCCVLFLLWVLSLFLFLTHTHSLSLPVSLYSFCSGHNIDCDNGIFFGFALFGCLLCFTFIYSFWYLQLCLFYFFFIRGHNIDYDKQWNIFVGVCIVCLGPCVPFVVLYVF